MKRKIDCSKVGRNTPWTVPILVVTTLELPRILIYYTKHNEIWVPSAFTHFLTTASCPDMFSEYNSLFCKLSSDPLANLCGKYSATRESLCLHCLWNYRFGSSCCSSIYSSTCLYFREERSSFYPRASWNDCIVEFSPPHPEPAALHPS